MRDLFTALALVLVIEGALYALFPDGVKRMMAMAQEIPRATLRGGGVTAVVLGVALVWLIRG